MQAIEHIENTHEMSQDDRSEIANSFKHYHWKHNKYYPTCDHADRRADKNRVTRPTLPWN